MKESSIIIVLLWLAAKGLSQPVVGEQAPPIKVDTWVDNPHSLYDDYQGKVIVLDFWFTSCAPCLYTMPHLNDLANEYRQEAIAFLAVTFEKAADVTRFLHKKKLLAMVGTDTTKQLIRSYGVKAYPHTFIIDQQGKLVWEGYPTEITGEMLEVILQKEFYQKVVTTELPVTGHADLKTKKYHLDIEVNDYQPGGSGMMTNNKEISIQNKLLNETLAYLLEVSEQRVLVADTITRYDMRFKIPRDIPAAEVRPLMAGLIADELQLTLESVKRQVRGYTLFVANDSLFINHAVDTHKKYRGKGTTTYKSYWQGSGLTITDVVVELENRYNIYVFDKTMLNGYFEFTLPNDFDRAAEKLFNHYGLALLPDTREIAVYQLRQYSGEN